MPNLTEDVPGANKGAADHVSSSWKTQDVDFGGDVPRFGYGCHLFGLTAFRPSAEAISNKYLATSY
jgi:hypothetical protein